MADESYDEQYLLQKQLSHEFHSPGYKTFSDSFRKSVAEQEEQFTKDLTSQGVSKDEAGASVGGL